MKKEKDGEFVEILIGLPEGEEWSHEKFAAAKAAMEEHARKRTPEQKRKLDEFAKENFRICRRVNPGEGKKSID